MDAEVYWNSENDEEIKRITNLILKQEEKATVERLLEEKQMKELEIVVVAHPKHKGTIGALKAEGYKIYPMYTREIEEDKIYQITDEDLKRNYIANMEANND